MVQRGYFASFIINELIAQYSSDRTQILMIQTNQDMLLYIKDKISGGTCQTNRI